MVDLSFQPELSSSAILTDQIQKTIRKPRELSPVSVEKISLKSHKLEKIPKEESVSTLRIGNIKSTYSGAIIRLPPTKTCLC